MKKKGLGRGLNALLDGAAAAEEAKTPIESKQLTLADDPAAKQVAPAGFFMVDIRKVEPNPTQPRQYFDEDALRELAESMKTLGIIQPLLVNDNGGHYTIIAGERRYRAARMAQLTEVPVIVKEYTEMEILQAAIIENIQRQDLTTIEEATGYKRLMDEFFFSADDIATKLGKNKHSVISALHLLELTPRAQELAAEGKLTASHAKVLLGVEDPELQAACAEKIVEEGLSVRAAEAMVSVELKAAAKLAAEEQEGAEDGAGAAHTEENTAYAYRRAEFEMKRVLGSQVQIRPGKKVSKIEIEYYSTEDLDRILAIFRKVQQ
ncbi:MAG: ParB/RepB/Spo0J family partition protein [Firmicutes bacterium]|nr:ParB/RepB/Spo0J family partition protein [Bacillota bacterium]